MASVDTLFDLGGQVFNKAEEIYAKAEESKKISPDFVYFLSCLVFLWIARVCVLQTLLYLGRTPYAEARKLTKRPAITDKQIERESVWKYGYLYDTLSACGMWYFGLFNSLPLFNAYGLVLQVLWHATVVEFVYYWFHRLLHVGWFYKKLHQYHHKSINTEPTTALSFEIVERLSYTALFAIAPICTDFMGQQSLVTFALYFIAFDFLNEGGHINFEVVPQWYLRSPLRFILYTPTFHSVHHTKFKKNYSLFMPWTDIVFGTATYVDDEKNSGEFLPVTQPKKTDFVLLVHGGYMTSALYSSKIHGRFGDILNLKNKYQHEAWMYMTYPFLFLTTFYLSVLCRMGYHYEEEFPFYQIDQETGATKSQMTGATWTVRNFAPQYLVPSFKKLINERIERAILDAASKGVRVVGLGNFNKAEWMNHGGADIVEKYKEKLQGTYISHGDTLSAAVIYQYAMQLKAQGYWSQGVFITGATSKIGRGVVLSFAKQHIRVVMLTQCKERYDEIAEEAGEDKQYLIYAASLSEGKGCDLWLTGKMIPRGKELIQAIPYDATIVNFSVPDPLTPALMKLRPDLLHLDSGLLAYDTKAMAPEFTWLLPKGVIYACLGGAIVHSLVGIQDHEVGAVKIEEMDVYWNAAKKFGFGIPPASSFYSPITMPPPKHI